MKFLQVLLCFIIASSQISFNSAEVVMSTHADPNNPGKCVVHNMVLEPGTVVKHPDACGKITCYAGGKASIVTCPPMVPPTDCSVGDPMHPEGNYPNCCRMKIVCKNGIQFSS